MDENGDVFQTAFDDYNIDYTNKREGGSHSHHHHHHHSGGHHVNQFTATPHQTNHHGDNEGSGISSHHKPSNHHHGLTDHGNIYRNRKIILFEFDKII